jgi:acetylornithine deacetylase/succinyl-diaminopimelate desuccinylase-like protein
VPDNKQDINNALTIFSEESVGKNYQESLQYPSLNVRQIETSWKGKGLKTIIPEYATAHIDVRLVEETDGKIQLEKIKKHIKREGYLVLDREPTNKERLSYAKIATFKGDSGVNAFRTPLNSPFGEKLRNALTRYFGKEPVSIRTMGGTVPIIPAINELDIPAIIVPMVNMDNNQHNPNENIRIGNIRQGIKICLAILNTNFD